MSRVRADEETTPPQQDASPVIDLCSGVNEPGAAPHCWHQRRVRPIGGTWGGYLEDCYCCWCGGSKEVPHGPNYLLR